MGGGFDGGMFAGFFIFWLVWLLAAREIVRGTQHGEMVAYGRRGTFDNAVGSERVTYRNQTVSFCLLFVFYLGVVVLVPAVTMHIAKDRGGLTNIFKWQPPAPPPENNPGWGGGDAVGGAPRLATPRRQPR